MRTGCTNTAYSSSRALDPAMSHVSHIWFMVEDQKQTEHNALRWALSRSQSNPTFPRR